MFSSSTTLYPTHLTYQLTTVTPPLHIYSPSDEQAEPIAPMLTSMEPPTRIEVQIPRTTYHTSDVIPAHVTFSVPATNTAVDQGLRLRSVCAELV